MTAFLGIALAIFLPSLCVWLLLAGILPAAGHPIERGGRMAMSVVMGIGASSFTAYVWLLFGGGLGPVYAIADASVFAAAAVYAWQRLRRGGFPDGGCAPVSRDGGLASWLFAAVVLIAAGCFIWLVRDNPNGDFDAWVIWNLKARFFLRGGASAWRDAFVPELAWSSTEYPLLIPLAIARLWSYAGETSLGPAYISGAFTFAAPLILAGAVAAGAGPRIGAIAGMLLIGTPGFISLGAGQYADVPVAACILASGAVLALAGDVDGKQERNVLVVGGFLIGLTAWTKNEGLAAAFLVTAASAFKWLREGGVRRVCRSVPALAIGMSVPAAAWLYFHWKLMPRLTGSLFLKQGSTTALDRMLDVGRWAAAGRGMLVHLPGWCFGFPFLVLAAAVFAGMKPSRLMRHEAMWTAAGLYLVFFTVFLATSWDTEWQLALAADRTLLQIWPLLLFALFASVRAGGGQEP